MESAKMRSDLFNEILILQKWRDSSAVIKLRLASASFAIQAWAFVVRADESEVALNFRDGDGFLTFNPSQCSLRYQEPREADDSVKSDVETKAVCALSAAFSGDTDLFLYEWRSDE